MLVIYLDDFLLLATSTETCNLQCSKNSPFKSWLYYEQKPVISPVENIEYLGMVIDSVNMTFTLPSVKTQTIKMLANDILQKQEFHTPRILAMRSLTLKIRSIVRSYSDAQRRLLLGQNVCIKRGLQRRSKLVEQAGVIPLYSKKSGASRVRDRIGFKFEGMGICMQRNKNRWALDVNYF